MLAALAVRDFRYLWFSTASDQLAMWVQIVAQGWLAYQLGGSATFLGVVSAASAVPNIALMLPGGVIADRRRKVKRIPRTLDGDSVKIEETEPIRAIDP